MPVIRITSLQNSSIFEKPNLIDSIQEPSLRILRITSRIYNGTRVMQEIEQRKRVVCSFFSGFYGVSLSNWLQGSRRSARMLLSLSVVSNYDNLVPPIIICQATVSIPGLVFERRAGSGRLVVLHHPLFFPEMCSVLHMFDQRPQGWETSHDDP